MKWTLLTITLFMTPQHLPAQTVYRCEVNGETTFAQTPCAADAAKHKVWGGRTQPPAKEQVPPMAAEEIAALSAQGASALIAGVVTRAEVLAKNCERDMYVRNTIIPCLEFISFLGGGQWQNGVNAANHLSENHPTYNDSNLQRAASRMETVQRVRAAFTAQHSN